jgi:hypothetical protein
MRGTTDLPPVEPGSSPSLPPPGLLTRRQAHLDDTLGRPISFSTATKLAAVGEFAELELRCRRRPLYRAEWLERWAKGGSPYRRPPLKGTQPAEHDVASGAAPEGRTEVPTPEAARNSRSADKRGKAGRRRVEASEGA